MIGRGTVTVARHPFQLQHPDHPGTPPHQLSALAHEAIYPILSHPYPEARQDFDELNGQDFGCHSH